MRQDSWIAQAYKQQQGPGGEGPGACGLLCVGCCALIFGCGGLGLYIFWWVAFFQDDAGPNMDGESCTNVYLIMLLSLCLQLGNIVCSCCSGSTNMEQIEEPTAVQKLAQCTVGLCMLTHLGVAIWGLVDFFDVDSACEAIIEEKGSDLLWIGYQSWAYTQLVGLSLMACCCCCAICGLACGFANAQESSI